MLFTIGHSNTSASSFCERLISCEIENVIDVRRVPYSQYCPQYNRETLCDTLCFSGVKYTFLGSVLGAFSYEKTNMECFVSSLRDIVFVSQQKNIALMCAEGHPYPIKRNPSGCHRWWKLTRYILSNFSVEVRHILLDRNIQKGTLEEYKKYRIDKNGNVYSHLIPLF
jgi:uncharacterized protein (DUF488 family)